jgi:hypothetical protein
MLNDVTPCRGAEPISEHMRHRGFAGWSRGCAITEGQYAGHTFVHEVWCEAHPNGLCRWYYESYFTDEYGGGRTEGVIRLSRTQARFVMDQLRIIPS